MARAGTVRVGGRRKARWRCRCDCGAECLAIGLYLRRGRKLHCSRKCPILIQKLSQPRGGLTTQHPSEYRSWEKMHDRVRDKKHHRYKNYGGRGIKICRPWYKFKNFLADMGPKPHPSYTIERIDVHGDYEPSNCRWATRAEQYRNTTRSVMVEWKGERIWLKDLCSRFNIPRRIVYGRFKQMGWPLERALLTPVKKYKQ